MTAESVREMLQDYLDTLVARGDYGRFFADAVHFEVMGTGQQADGAEAVEQTIRWLHEAAFDAHPEVVAPLLVGEHGGAVELIFAGTHTGEFAGVPRTGASVRVPYSVFYDVADGVITALRAYLPMDQLVGQLQAPAGAEAR